VGTAVPDRVMSLVGGLPFLGFGIWTLLDRTHEDEQAQLRGSSVLLGLTAAFLVAEFGDKTMLATAALASTNSALPTWAGASLGMTAASGLAIALAVLLGAGLPQRTVRVVAAGGFLLFGALLITDGLRG
jgi:Ca2+/H+ antiporter, TMEM165/GDT1 family